MKHFFFFLCFGMMVISGYFTSCGNAPTEKESPADTVNVADSAVAYYSLQSQGKFDDYVDKMHSCLNMSVDYRNSIIVMLKQHQTYILKAKHGVKDVEPIRSEFHDANKMANVFLKVTFNDNSQEEVMFPMVYDKGKWWVQ